KSIAVGSRVLHSRLFIHRDGLAEFLQTAQPVFIDSLPEEANNSWEALCERFNRSLPPVSHRNSWRFVKTAADLASSTDELLSRTGKSQDGMVSRYLNRPLSRTVSRYLLRFDVAPTALTAG